MEFAELLPKTTTPEEERGVLFCSGEEGVRQAIKIRPAGKLLFVTDGSALRAFRTCLPPRALCLVLDSCDCLPLFLASDDVSMVVAAGGESTLMAARFFAQIRKIPCAVFPVSAALDGVYEACGRVTLGGTSDCVPLKEAQVYCDRELVAPSLGQAYMRLLLSRLALIEARAMRGFGMQTGSEEAEERAYQTLLPLKAKSFTLEDVVLKNASLRQCEREGMAAGEGTVLARRIGPQGDEQAYFMLSALYATFFAKGKARLKVPDYAARAREAETAYCEQRVPTLQEFIRRAVALERVRPELNRELGALSEGETHFRRNFYMFSGRAVTEARAIQFLKKLPECTAGLSTVIRDFGLMEWDDDFFKKSV